MLDHQDYEGNVFNMADEFAQSKNSRLQNIDKYGITSATGMIAGCNYINSSQPMKRSNNRMQSMKPMQPMPSKKAKAKGRMGAMVDTLRVPQQPGDEIDDLIDFKAQSETEAIEEQMLKEIME